MDVIKLTGEREAYDEDKVRSSIKRVGIPQDLQEQVVRHVNSKAYQGIPTSEIYHHVLEFLNQKSPYAKAKFSLKQAIMDLGPTGYPFEDFIASLLKTQGFRTKTRQILQGKCVTHEIDVVGEKDSAKIMVEAKFHNQLGIKTNIHVALYTKARFDDVKENNNLSKAWLVTNTKITAEAIAYANCSGVVAVGWNYPKEKGLKDMVEEAKLIPITVLSGLSQTQKGILVSHDTVVCRQIFENPGLLDELNLSKEKEDEVLKEVEFVHKA